METKEYKNIIIDFYKDQGFKKIISPGLVFTKLLDNRRFYLIINIKCVPKMNLFSISYESPILIFEDVAKHSAAAYNAKGIKLGKETIHLIYGIDEQIYSNLINGGGFHKVENPIEKFKTFENSSKDEIRDYISNIYQKQLEILNRIESLTKFFNIVEGIDMQEWDRTVNGNFYFLKMILRKLFDHPEYDDYVEFVKKKIIESKAIFVERDDLGYYETLLPDLEALTAYLENCEPIFPWKTENLDNS